MKLFKWYKNQYFEDYEFPIVARENKYIFISIRKLDAKIIENCQLMFGVKATHYQREEKNLDIHVSNGDIVKFIFNNENQIRDFLRR
jgi:hypothetical protein